VLLEGKTVLVAGIGPGLGRSVAIKAAEDGADVALVARSDETLDHTEKEVAAIGGRVAKIKGDVTNPDDCTRIAQTTVAELGGIDCVVYNAYAPWAGSSAFDGADLSDWRRAVEVNAFGALELIQACLPALKERRGNVVLISSRVIRRPHHGGYAMSKAALGIAGHVLASELGPIGIRVNTVVPGWMWSPPVEGFFENNMKETGKSIDEQYREVVDEFPLRTMPTADDVANSVVFLASDRAAAITGQSLDVNAGEAFT
jgi:NAD(P)-dependent dehydrogenase (short-subunit alcohol dehydrogenase family)